MDEQIYKENILDRYKNPRHKKMPEKFDVHEGGVNASCGDSFITYLSFDEEGRIKEANFDGEGCAVSQAAADMLMEKLLGKKIDEVEGITEKDIYDMLGITIGPSREKCALLPLNTLRRFIGEMPLGPI